MASRRRPRRAGAAGRRRSRARTCASRSGDLQAPPAYPWAQGGVTEAGAGGTGSAMKDQGGVAQARRVDVTAKAEVDALAAAVVAEFGKVDILVNSAGSAYRSAAEEFPEDRFDFILNLNLKGTYLCCQAFGRKMLSQGSGSIINLGSIGSFIGYPWASAYLASKGGVLGITRGLALV